MLKVIPVNQLRLGMFIQQMQGAWFEHPFWRKSFMLKDDDDLEKLLVSRIPSVVIDTAKGVDAMPFAPTPVLPQNEPVVTALPGKKQRPISFDDEKTRAGKLIQSSKVAVSSMFSEVRMGKAINSENALPLVNDIVASVSRNQNAFTSLVRLKSKDDYTYMHSVAVCALMVALARELGLDEDQIRQAGMAGLLHDIGKMVIPDEVLNKPGALSDDEFMVVRRHSEFGHAILSRSHNIDEVCLDVCLHHHEKIDGSGYPHKLKGDEISLFAKMGAVCDVYDAVTSNRPYKAGWEPGVSLQRMSQWTEHFDQVVFKAFVKCVGIYPIGSLVKLKSGRLGVVMDQSAQSLLTPVVKVFFSTKSKTRIAAEVIDLSKVGAHDQILGHEDPRVWGINDLSEMWG
ncbi:MAG: HD-GYP domain-containing protein [Candidatus Methylopumilus sp.]|jgi:putative nucleotidyltransferase with HDIG domain